MKKFNVFNGGECQGYSAPSVAAVEVAVEKGFAFSLEDGFYEDSLPDLDFGGELGGGELLL